MIIIQAILLSAVILVGVSRYQPSSEVVVFTPPPPPMMVSAAIVVEETTDEIFERIASDYSTTTREVAFAIINEESHFRNECNKEYGCFGGIGFFQIVQSTFDEQCEGDVYDAEDNIRCGFKMLEQGDHWRWAQSADKWIPKLKLEDVPMACSCIKTARSLGTELPYGTNAYQIQPNTKIFKGALALFSYPEFGHVATVTRVGLSSFSVYEGNYSKCKFTKREIDFNDPSLIGFYTIEPFP